MPARPGGEAAHPPHLTAGEARATGSPVSTLLAHLSDAHIGPLPRPRARDLLGKRLTGFVNWRRRGKLHDMAVLADIVADLKAQAPDHVAMTGDILNLGLPEEFPFARAWLRTLGTTDQVSFVPGNHDAYVRSSLPHLASTFAPWVSEVGTADGMPFAFPYLRRRGPLALIGLSSAIPTAPLLASGALGSAQREGLARLLDEAGAEGSARVVMIHHPPHVTGAKRGRGLRDAAAFEAVIARHGAELVIHGHNHRTSVSPPARAARARAGGGGALLLGGAGHPRPPRRLPPLSLRGAGGRAGHHHGRAPRAGAGARRRRRARPSGAVGRVGRPRAAERSAAAFSDLGRPKGSPGRQPAVGVVEPEPQQGAQRRDAEPVDGDARGPEAACAPACAGAARGAVGSAAGGGGARPIEAESIEASSCSRSTSRRAI